MEGCGWAKAKGCASTKRRNYYNGWIEQGAIFQPMCAQSKWANWQFPSGKTSCGVKVVSHDGDQNYHAYGEQSLNLKWMWLGGDLLHPKWCGYWLDIHHPWPHHEGQKTHWFQATIYSSHLQVHWCNTPTGYYGFKYKI